jgi:NADP-dependent 3-hydroxy acid dehydrogenase YdfG
MNKTVLITGASRGIGKSIALALAKEKFDLLLWSRSIDDLDRVRHECAAFGIQAMCAQVDVANPESIQTSGAKSLTEISSLKGLIINAGVGEWAPFDQISISDFKWMLDVNLVGAFSSIQLVLPLLRSSPYSRLVVIGSDSSEVGFKNRAAYCSSKWGLYGLIESLRNEIREEKINITHLMTSRVDTFFRNQAPGHRKNALNPEHVAEVVAFLFLIPDIVEIRELKMSSIHSSYGLS